MSSNHLSATDFSRNTLCKYERLKSRKEIESLFAQGGKLFEYPYLMRWQLASLPTKFPAQMLVSVPKKRFRKAVWRIKIKRLIREAYRKNKGDIYGKLAADQKQMAIAIVYVGKEIPSYGDAEKKIIILLQRLLKVYESGKKNTG